MGFGEVHAPFPWKIHSKVLDTRPVPNKQNIPQGPTPGYNFWIRACNKRRQDIMALSPLHPLILLMTVHYNIVIEINCLIIMYNLDLAQWIQQQTTDPNCQSLKTCTARTFFFYNYLKSFNFFFKKIQAVHMFKHILQDYPMC